MSRTVVFAADALSDLIQLYAYIEQESGVERAHSYTERVRSYCMGFAEFGERGTRRDDLRPGMRVIGFERRVTIAFHVTTDLVVIDRILYGGRSLSAAFASPRRKLPT